MDSAVRVVTHICLDDPIEPPTKEQLARRAELARLRYWRRLVEKRAIALRSYYRHLAKNRAAARERERLKRLSKVQPQGRE